MAGKLPINPRLLMIGGGSFVVFVVAFFFLLGSPAPEPQIAEETALDSATHEDHPEDDAYIEDLYSGSWHDEYSPIPSEDNSALSEEDSIKQVAWYETQRNEIQKARLELERDKATLEQLRNETKVLLDQRKAIEETNVGNLAKLFETMKSEEVAAIMQNIPDVEVGLILQRMKKQSASEVMAELPSERAAKITMQLIDLDGGF